jgi:hypothetical protein
MMFLFKVASALSLPHLSNLEAHVAVDHVMKGGGRAVIQATLDKAVESFTNYKSLDLPPLVQTLLHKKQGADGDVKLDPESIAKARKILNALVEAAQKELDDKTMECKEFIMAKERAIDIIDTDLASLATVVTFAEGLQTQSNSGIQTAIQGIEENKQRLKEEGDAYFKQLQIDQAEMTWRRNDLMVGEFILKLTKCPKAGFLQTETNLLRDCTDKNGKHTTRFHDDKLHAAMLKMGSSTRQMFDKRCNMRATCPCPNRTSLPQAKRRLARANPRVPTSKPTNVRWANPIADYCTTT